MMPFRRLACSRRGDWIQIILLLFFALLLIFAIVLLTIESKRLDVTRPQLEQDLKNQRANAFLISMLRADTTGIDGKVTMGDAIIMNDGGRYNAALQENFERMTQTTKATGVVRYPDGRVLFLWPSGVVIRNKDSGTAASNAPAATPSRSPTPSSRSDVPSYSSGGYGNLIGRAFGDRGEPPVEQLPSAGHASTVLPGRGGNIEIELMNVN